MLPTPGKKSAEPQGQNAQRSDSPLDFLKRVSSPLRMDCDSLGTHTEWQLSTSETFGRDTLWSELASRAAQDPTLCAPWEVGGWEAAQAAPVRQPGISLLTHPCSRCDSPNVTRSEFCPSEQMCDSIHPIYPPDSLSERRAVRLSLLPQTEPGAFDLVVHLVGTGPRPAHSVFIGRN